MIEYRVHIQHPDDDVEEFRFRVEVFEAGSSKCDRQSVAWALRQAADIVENGQSIAPNQLN